MVIRDILFKVVIVVIRSSNNNFPRGYLMMVLPIVFNRSNKNNFLYASLRALKESFEASGVIPHKWPQLYSRKVRVKRGKGVSLHSTP
jgi:hypothetical protein